jgi:hypothetical protein
LDDGITERIGEIVGPLLVGQDLLVAQASVDRQLPEVWCRRSVEGDDTVCFIEFWGQECL